LEHSGDDEDYLSDLDEKFRDLSSEVWQMKVSR
jgi:hypothetical protein